MDLEKTAIERIRTASQMSLQHYGLPLVVTDSGGKDSAVCRELVRRSGVPFELMHNLTTADAPQTIYYVREQFQKAEQAGITCSINKPYYKGQRITMWSLIPMKMIPPNDAIKDMADRVVKLRDGMIRRNYQNEQKIPAADLEW